MFFRKKKSRDVPAVRERPEADEAGATPSASAADPSADQESLPSGPASSTQFLTGEAVQDRKSVQVLLDTLRRISDFDDLEALQRYIVDSSVQVTGAERGLLLLRGEDGKLEVSLARLRDGLDVEGEPRFSTTVAGRVLERLEPVRATVNTESEALDLGRSVYDLKLRAVMCVPLASDTTGEGHDGAPPQGVLYVDSRAATREFTQRDLSFFAALADQMSLVMERARLHQDSLEKERLRQSMALASAIQHDLMPEVPGILAGFDVHGWYRPAESAAGDFYDFVDTEDGRLAVVVGDATGHGVGPALITATVQGGLRSYLQILPRTGDVVTRLNRDLCKRVKDGRFLTLFLGTLRPDGTLEALNAGHEPPLLWRAATGEVEPIKGSGPALGMLDEFTYEAHEDIQLDSGDLLVIFTDGLSEARSAKDPDHLFGVEGLQRVVEELGPRELTAKDITLKLAEAALTLAEGAREDDMTLVVVRRT